MMQVMQSTAADRCTHAGGAACGELECERDRGHLSDVEALHRP